MLHNSTAIQSLLPGELMFVGPPTHMLLGHTDHMMVCVTRPPSHLASLSVLGANRVLPKRC